MFRRNRRVTTGTQLARDCWMLLRANTEWLKIPLLSAAGVALITVVFGVVGLIIYAAAPNASSSDNQHTATTIVGIVLLFLYYFATYSVIIYSETALVSIVLMKIRGQKDNPTAGDGFAVAQSRLGTILGFAALSATVGVIARLIFDSGRNSKNLIVMIIASILASIIQASWTFATLMVTPVIATENLSVFPAIQRSWNLFKQTWGEQVVGRFSLGALGCLLTLGAMLPGGLILVLGGTLNSPAILVSGFAILLLGIALVALLSSAVGAIFKALIYQYATEGNAGNLVDEAHVRGVFVSANA